MSDLVEKVAKIIDLDDCTATERAKAAISVVLKEMDKWENLQPILSASSKPFVREFALKNGVSLDE